MRIAVLCLAGLGDTLLAVPMLRSLKKNFPDSKLEVFVMYDSSKKILKGFSFIDKIINVDFFGKGYLRTFLDLLKHRGKYDVSISAYPANRLEYNFVSFIMGAKKRIAHDYTNKRSFLRAGYFLQTDLVKQKYPLRNIDENLRLLKKLDIDIDEEDRKINLVVPKGNIRNADNFVNKLNKKRHLIGIHPGSGETKNFINKRWSKEKFIRLIDILNSKYDCNIILFGGSDEVRLKKEISDRVEGTVFLFDGDILDVSALIQKCDLFISNDTGLFNLASALGTKLIGIFGPTDPRLVEPIDSKYEIVTNFYPCSPCYFYSSMNLGCPKNINYECLSSIEVEQVLNAISKLM